MQGFNNNVMTKTKAIIFDLGKVVFDLSFDRIFQSWSDSSGKSFEEIRSNFEFDSYFDWLEKNEISNEQFRLHVSRKLKMNITNEDFDKGWCNLYLDVYPGVEEMLINLKSRYRLIALTNTNAIHAPIWKEKYKEVLVHFEKIFSSHELIARKPESKIFEIALDYLQLNAEQTLFLDDNLININGAKSIGISTLLVSSFEQMKDDLMKMQIIIHA